MKLRKRWLMFGVLAAAVAAGIRYRVIDRLLHPDNATRPVVHVPGSGKGPPKVREPAVAGLFYTAAAPDLSRSIQALLAKATPDPVDGELKALICPHAGYRYSGLTAAFAYKLLAGCDVQTVILLAPSHHASFPGVSVCAADVYRTPLGDVPLSEKAKKLAAIRPFVPEPRVLLRRPEWRAEASHPEPPLGEDTPETWEHSGEVQVPFLQTVLKDFELLPVIFGDANPEQAARGLAEVIDGRTLVIASSDLSHYHPYPEAEVLDKRCVAAICDLDTERIKKQEACGSMPIQTLMHLAKLRGWKPKLLDLRNSGDVTGDKTGGVVGYAAIAFHAPASDVFTPGERSVLLDLARRTVQEVAAEERIPKVDPEVLPARLRETKGCFVTLTKSGDLRGCIGHIVARMPLYKAVIENARNAASRDSRFQPVEPWELEEIRVEISVLSEPQPLEFTSPADLLDKLRPGKDGVVLQIGRNSATFLPQVWEHFPKKEEFLDALSQKAGCEPGAWRGPGTKVLIYQVEAFKEPETKP